MALTKIIELLDELEGPLAPWVAQARVHELVLALATPQYLDARTRARIEAVSRRFGGGVATPAVWTPAAGETYLPLFAPAASTVARIAVRRSSRPGVHGAPRLAPALDHARRALDGLSASLAEIGAGLPDALECGHEIEVEHGYGGSIPVDGPSLGLPLCIAMASRRLGQAPRPDVAASAQVTAGGQLRAVGNLAEKATALAREAPGVRTLVVAEEQSDVANTSGLFIVRCANLAETWRHFDLDVTPRTFPPTGLGELRRQLATFPEQTAIDDTRAEWQSHASRAVYVSAALAPHDASQSTEAAIWAALFALHSGDVPRATRYIDAITTERVDDLGVVCRVWHALVSATLLIDRRGEHERAIVAGRQAVALAQELRPADRRGVFGRACGTLGRALTHAGRFDEAQEWLRRAVDFHSRERPDEEPRSRCYLVTCLRAAGEHETALAESERAMAGIAALPHSESAVKTRPYLLLERGRAFLGLGRMNEARAAFVEVSLGQSRDSDYPRVGGLRGLANACASMDIATARDALERCLVVAEDATVGDPIREIAAYAAGDALVDERLAAGFDRERLERVWRLHGAPDPASVRSVLARAIY